MHRMRLPKRDKQNMYYSNFVGTQKEYQTDDEGNIVYVDIDGVQTPIETGIVSEIYDTPLAFRSSISSSLNEMHIKSWGVDQSSIYSELCVPKGYLPLKIGAIIWRTSEIEWDDEEHGIPKASSSDYTVCGLMDEGLTEDLFLLKRNSSEEEESPGVDNDENNQNQPVQSGNDTTGD